jgi:hypothetical protein
MKRLCIAVSMVAFLFTAGAALAGPRHCWGGGWHGGWRGNWGCYRGGWGWPYGGWGWHGRGWQAPYIVDSALRAGVAAYAIHEGYPNGYYAPSYYYPQYYNAPSYCYPSSCGPSYGFYGAPVAVYNELIGSDIVTDTVTVVE